MTELTHPYQPFIVRYHHPLSQLEIESLIRLYQPIIGVQAVNLYLLLHQQPLNDSRESSPKVHSVLFPLIQNNLGVIDEARMMLEAIGLMKTYKETVTHQYPTLLYDLKSPLLLPDFMQQPFLVQLFIHQVGESELHDMIKVWEIPAVDQSLYDEVTVSFDTIFNTKHRVVDEQMLSDLKERVQMESQPQVIQPTDMSAFNYSEVVRQLNRENVHFSIFNERLRNEILAIYYYYGLTERQMVQYVLRHYDKKTHRINFEEFRQVSSDDLQSLRELDKKEKVLSKPSSDTEAPTQEQSHAKEYDVFTAEEWQLVKLCQNVTPLEMLNQIKKDKNGFVTDSERYYLQQIADSSRLDKSVQSFLVYYLLVILQRSNFQKNESQRIANEWQQAQLSTVEACLLHIRQVLRHETIQKTKTTNNYVTKRHNGYAKRTEVVPEWKKTLETSPEQTESNVISQQSNSSQTVSSAKQRLNELLNKGGDLK